VCSRAFAGTAFAQTTGTANPSPLGTPAAKPAAVATTPPAASTSADYRLAAGDTLRIEVYKDDPLSQSLQIRPDGKSTLPLVADLLAAGRRSMELRDSMSTALKDYTTNSVVTMITRRPMLPESAQAPALVKRDPQSGASQRIVAIGGGTGLPNLLRGLRPLVFPEGLCTDATRDRLVAVVATSDDGGSSGRLRATFNMIPPGDIRNCLAALATDQSQMTDLFQYRFGAGEGLIGHPIGNLLIAALTDVTQDFAHAVELAGRILGACGVVLPATSEVVTLVAEFHDGRVLTGETAIVGGGGTISRLSLLPERPSCSLRVRDALACADVIVAGPGSLYTSILPPLLVPHVAGGIWSSRATRILVANLMTEAGETDEFSVLDHLLTIERHVGRQLFDCVIYNTSPVPERLAASYAGRGARPIVTGAFELNALERFGVRAIGVPLISEHPAGKVRHNPDRLASAIAALAHGTLGAWRVCAEAGGP